ncbi:hypothetical protein ACFQV2_15025 [Actinokineospora soli]|uniref:Uncharacterized protein n=1 Tax=Actinokineospora soli TaxID=1048753 RepID=A0ABW2TMP6_9PSEU
MLRQRWEFSAGTRVSTWGVIQNDAPEDEVRRLRVHVCRLHTGFAAAESVLGLCHADRLNPNRPEVERFLLRTLDVLLRPKRHGFSNAYLLGQVIGYARDVYWDTMTTLQHALDTLDNPKLTDRVQELHDLVASALRPGRDQIVLQVQGSLMENHHHTHISGTVNGPLNSGSGGAHQHNHAVGQAEVGELLTRLRAALAEVAPALDREDAVDAENAAAGLEREAGNAPGDRTPGRIQHRLGSLFDIAQRAGESGAALVAAVTAVSKAFDV